MRFKYKTAHGLNSTTPKSNSMKLNFFNSWNSPESSQRMDLVFENRFKDYGAYDLRRRYAKVKVMAMGFTLLLLGLLFSGPLLFAKDAPAVVKHPPLPPDTTTDYHNIFIIEPEPERVVAQNGGGESSDGQPSFDPSAPNLPLPPLGPGSGIPGVPNWGEGPGNVPKDPGEGNPTTKNNGGGKAPELPDVTCEPHGGIDAFTQYIQDNFNQEASCDDLIEGYALVRFTVGEDGRISQVSLVESTHSCPQFAVEVMRIIAASPNWKAAQLHGSFVKCYRIVPVKLSFRNNAP